MKLIPSATHTEPVSRSPASAPRRDGDGALVLDRFLPYRLSVLANTVSRSIARLYADRFGLTIPEWRVLAVLGSDGPCTANAICRRTAMDKVQVSRAVAGLVRKALVAQRRDEADRRRADVTLTPAGTDVLARIAPLARAREAALLAALGPGDRDRLDSLIASLQEAAEALDTSD